jgi:hypothetical protein
MEHGFGIFMNFLQYYSMDNLYFRTAMLKGDNPQFLPNLLKVDKEETKAIELEIGMMPSERLYWRLITDLYMDNMFGVPDCDDIPFLDVMERMRLLITVSTKSESEEENGKEDEDMESILKPHTSLAEVNELLAKASPAENMSIEEDVYGDEPADELTSELAITRDDKSVQQGGSPIDRGLNNNENFIDYLMRDVENDDDASENEYIPFSIWSLLHITTARRKLNQDFRIPR